MAKPANNEYQSLHANVPIKLEEVVVDSSMAPILFAIPVRGHVAASYAGNLPGGTGAGGTSILSTDSALEADYVVDFQASVAETARQPTATVGPERGCALWAKTPASRPVTRSGS